MEKGPIVVRLNANTCPMIDEEREILQKINAQVVEIEGGSDDEILEASKDADAIIISSSYLHPNVLEQLPNLKLISRLGTGCDKIDLEMATKCGIVVSNLPDFSTDEVADHAMALLLASARRLKQHEAYIRRGQKPQSVEGMHRLSTQTLGIVGLGHIGRAVARRAQGFGMRVIGYDPFVTKESAAESGIELVDFETLLKTSDFVSLLCPYTPQTAKMMSMKQFKMMKPTAIFVNNGRGELVNEDDLAEALKTGVIQYAAVDVFHCINVFTEGGFPTTHSYFSLDNILLTPHVSANSLESLRRSRCDGAQSVVDYFNGFYPYHIVNTGVKSKIELHEKK